MGVYKCEYPKCEKEYKCEGHFKRHMNVHTGRPNRSPQNIALLSANPFNGPSNCNQLTADTAVTSTETSGNDSKKPRVIHINLDDDVKSVEDVSIDNSDDIRSDINLSIGECVGGDTDHYFEDIEERDDSINESESRRTKTSITRDDSSEDISIETKANPFDRNQIQNYSENSEQRISPSITRDDPSEENEITENYIKTGVDSKGIIIENIRSLKTTEEVKQKPVIEDFNDEPYDGDIEDNSGPQTKHYVCQLIAKHPRDVRIRLKTKNMAEKQFIWAEEDSHSSVAKHNCYLCHEFYSSCKQSLNKTVI